MSQLGRIGGKLLNPNLERDGIDLAFETDLLYFDVNEKRIGINNDSPIFDLEVNNINTSNLEVTVQANIDNFEISGVTFTTSVGGINIQPTGHDPVIELPGLTTADLKINDTTISSFSNSNIIFAPNNSGQIDLQSTTNVTGNLSVTGNITVDGDFTTIENLTLGDGIGDDTVTITPELEQNLQPGQDAVYNLGNSSSKWAEIHVRDQTTADNINLFGLRISNQIEIDGTDGSFTTLQSNDNLLISPDTGILEVESLTFQDSDITNLEDTPIQLRNTGIGYVRFQGTNGIVLPSGPTADRPNAPEVGDTRWNTENQSLECFDGNIYIVSIGPGDVIGESQMEELGNVYSLILG